MTNPNFRQFSPRPGAWEAIQDKTAPLVYRLSEADHLQLPELVINDVFVSLPREALRQYKQMEDQLFAELSGGELLVANTAGSAYGRCRQMANGRVYTDEDRTVEIIHTEKQEALQNLLDELQGKPAMIAYHYRHDYAAIREVVGDSAAHIGAGETQNAINRAVTEWNRGAVPVLICNPASMAHGLNLQSGGNDLIMYSLTDNLEDYQQLIKRLHRSGVRGSVRVHRIAARNTVDRAVMRRLDDKANTQSALLEALNNYRKGEKL
jgi:hypothetical protein